MKEYTYRAMEWRRGRVKASNAPLTKLSIKLIPQISRIAMLCNTLALESPSAGKLHSVREKRTLYSVMYRCVYALLPIQGRKRDEDRGDRKRIEYETNSWVLRQLCTYWENCMVASTANYGRLIQDRFC